jgi:hypothetical protein
MTTMGTINNNLSMVIFLPPMPALVGSGLVCGYLKAAFAYFQQFISVIFCPVGCLNSSVFQIWTIKNLCVFLIYIAPLKSCSIIVHHSPGLYSRLSGSGGLFILLSNNF